MDGGGSLGRNEGIVKIRDQSGVSRTPAESASFRVIRSKEEDDAEDVVEERNERDDEPGGAHAHIPHAWEKNKKGLVERESEKRPGSFRFRPVRTGQEHPAAEI